MLLKPRLHANIGACGQLSVKPEQVTTQNLTRLRYSLHSLWKRLNRHFHYFSTVISTAVNGVEVVIIAVEIQIRDLEPWVEKEIADVLAPLKEQGKKLIDKVKEKLDDVHGTCSKLEEDGEKEIEKGKAVRKAKVTQRLARYFLKQIGKVAFPSQISFAELENLQLDLEKMFSSIGRERNLWFPRISPLFIITRKRVDFALSRLGGSIADLTDFLSTDYSQAREAERLLLEAETLRRLVGELKNHEKQMARASNKMKRLRENVEKHEKEFEAMRGSAELSDLTKVTQNIKDCRRRVKHDLRHLQKPFMKLANLGRTGGFSLSSEETRKLSQYLEDPFHAFASEESGYPKLKNVLGKVELAINEGKLKLKSSRLRKAKQEINAIRDQSGLNDLHRNCVEATRLHNQLLSSDETHIVQEKVKKLRKTLDELKKSRKPVEAMVETLKKEHSQLEHRIAEKKRMLEKLVLETVGKSVEVKLKQG